MGLFKVLFGNGVAYVGKLARIFTSSETAKSADPISAIFASLLPDRAFCPIPSMAIS